MERKKTEKGVEAISITREEQKKACDSITKQLRNFRTKVVCNVMGIPAARVPIVKFVHIKSGLSCDLRFFKAPGTIKVVLNESVKFWQFM